MVANQRVGAARVEQRGALGHIIKQLTAELSTDITLRFTFMEAYGILMLTVTTLTCGE